MTPTEYVLLGYATLYLAAVIIGILRRNTFPLTEAIMITAIVGLGFTTLVYLIVPSTAISFSPGEALPTELVFVLGYLVLVALLLIRGVAPKFPSAWRDSFLKKKIITIACKVTVFVLIPIIFAGLLWNADWFSLGFWKGDVISQLRSAGLLILLLGGFNLVVGGGARPIRTHQFTARQLVMGFGASFSLNLVEVGLVEEFFFRAFVQGTLIRVLSSPVLGILTASLLFGLAHVPGIFLRGGERVGPLGERPTLLNTILYAILAIGPTGWFTGLLFWRTQSLLAPILVHAGVDTVSSASEFITEVVPRNKKRESVEV